MRLPRRLLAALLVAISAAAAARAQDDDATKYKETEGLFLDMSKVNLGTISSEDDKKKYIYTIQLEESRLTRQSLKVVYENAFDLYREGQFEGANELTQQILQIDPTYEDARILERATLDLKGSTTPFASRRRLISDRFAEGMSLYRQGRLVEAADRWDEVVKLSPMNLKARYWLRKTRDELAAEHFRRGQQAYSEHRLRDTLDQWYAALVLDPHYPRLTQAIAKVEAEERDEEANEKLQTALNLYSQGLVLDALKMLDQVLEIGPGNARAQKLQAEIRAEVANQHVAEGRRLYEGRQYDAAIAEWKTATDFGYDPNAADQLIARAKEQMRRDVAARQREAEQAKQKADEAAKQKADQETADAKAKADAAAAAAAKAAAQPAQSGAPADAGQPVAATPGVVSDAAKQQAEQAYLSGMVYFQQGNYEKARDMFMQAKELDPGNPDAAAGLDRIEKLYGGGQ